MELIQLQNVGLRFAGTQVLNKLDLSLAPGQRIALLGPSGVGKSSVLRLVAGLLKPSEGVVTNNAKRIGFVFQEPRLLPWLTVKQNLEQVLKAIKTPSNLIDEKVNTALAQVQLSETQDYFPHQLSGGMAQRVSLARAFIIEPDLLLLDEPFSALDIKLKQELSALMADYLSEAKPSLIYVSHFPMEVLPLTQRCLLLKPNQVPKWYPSNATESILTALKQGNSNESSVHELSTLS